MGPGAIDLVAGLDQRGAGVFMVGPGDDIVPGRQLADRARRAADRMIAWGLRPGDVVGVHGEASPDLLAALLGAWLSGVVVLPLNRRQPAERLERVIASAGCRSVFSDAQPPGELAARCPHVRLLDLVAGPGARPPAMPAARHRLAGAATILETAGTTGAPKLAVHPLDAYLASAGGAVTFLGLEEGDSWMLSLPLYHVGGLGVLFRTIIAGARIALPDPARPLTDEIRRLRPTHISLVPTQLTRLLDADDAPGVAAGLRCVVLGGGPISRRLRERSVARGVPVVVSYGSTEMTSMVTAGRERDDVLAPGGAGRLLPRRRLRLSPDGEILVGGDTLFSGYLRAEGIAEVRDDTGFFASGDTGSLDPGGRLTVLGRRDLMFVSGGENIHPEEIEEALVEHASIEEAVVVPLPDPEFGARPVAFVRPAPDCGVDPTALRDHLGRRLARFKIPDEFLLLPGTGPAGLKWNRRMLAAIAGGSEGSDEPLGSG